MLVRDDDSLRWWTWAGGRAHALIAAALSRTAPHLLHEVERFDNRYLRLNCYLPS